MPFFDAILNVEECSGVSAIAPSDGRTWGIKCRCTSCNEVSSHFLYIDTSEVQMTRAGGSHHQIVKCAFCKEAISIDVMPNSIVKCEFIDNELSGNGVFVQFDVRGGEPVEFELDNQWTITSEAGVSFEECDLSADWCEYDEKNAISLSVLGTSVEFNKSRKK